MGGPYRGFPAAPLIWPQTLASDDLERYDYEYKCNGMVSVLLRLQSSGILTEISQLECAALGR